MGLVGKEQRAPEAAGEIGLELGDAARIDAIRNARCGSANRVRSGASRGWATTRLPFCTVPGSAAATRRSTARPKSRPAARWWRARTTAPACRPPSMSSCPRPARWPRSTTSTPTPRSASSSAQARPATPAPMTMTDDLAQSMNSRSFAGMTRIRFKGFSPIRLSQPGLPGGARTPLGRHRSRESARCQAASGQPAPRCVDSPKPSQSGSRTSFWKSRHQGAGDRADLVVMAVDRAHRHDLGSRAAQEYLAGLWRAPAACTVRSSTVQPRCLAMPITARRVMPSRKFSGVGRHQLAVDHQEDVGAGRFGEVAPSSRASARRRSPPSARGPSRCRR